MAPFGVLAYPDIESLPLTPDLGVICVPPKIVPEALEELGKIGTRAAICLTQGIGYRARWGALGWRAYAGYRPRARHRLLGPNCVGAIVPKVGLNASFAHSGIDPGKIAFVSQSGAICASVLDWAKAQNVGFSYFISVGDAIDLDFGDIIDFLGSDPHTHAILLYMEAIRERRNFMSAARAAARNKPILVVKAGRNEAGPRPPNPIPARWPGRTPFTTPPFGGRGCFAYTTSRSCSAPWRRSPGSRACARTDSPS